MTSLDLSPPSGVQDDLDDCRPADPVARRIEASTTAPTVHPSILLVDDETSIHSIVKGYFRAHEFAVAAVPCRREMMRHLERGQVDLVVLDLRLGADDGLDALRELRAKCDVPVIVLTGHRKDEVDRIVGLELGADDYMIKPFGLRELLARVRVIMRRAGARVETPSQATNGGLSLFCGWTLDRHKRQLTDRHGEKVDLTKGEYVLLLAFLDAPQRPLSREYLLQATRVHEDIYDRSIDVQILRLRRKLEVDPSDPRIILTERGVGYVFAARVEIRSKVLPAAASVRGR